VTFIASQVCDALESAHALHIVHRDLKPANIMLLSQGRDVVKVLDFGLAKSVGQDRPDTTVTHSGALLGTPAFMPPELALGQECDGRADLYSLGCILYLLGTGRLPFVSDSPHELIALHASEPAPAMTNVPERLARVVACLLEKDPARRFQSAAMTRDALHAALEGRILTPQPSLAYSDTVRAVGDGGELGAVTASPQAPAEVRRSRRWFWPIALTLGVAAGGLTWSMFHESSAAQPDAPQAIAPPSALSATPPLPAAAPSPPEPSQASQPVAPTETAPTTPPATAPAATAHVTKKSPHKAQVVPAQKRVSAQPSSPAITSVTTEPPPPLPSPPSPTSPVKPDQPGSGLVPTPF
jgi:serine/threonine-protein kinase